MGTKRTQQKREYAKQHYGWIRVAFDKDIVEKFNEIVKSSGQSKTSVIKELVLDYIEKNN